jgi:hypothetical protein
MLDRMSYRFQQFWSAVTAAPARDELEQARLLLGAGLYPLFIGMPPAEQAHALKVLAHLQHDGANQPDLLRAALLHDLGKSWLPLHLWERALIVLARNIFPERMAAWGNGQPDGWRRPFVVAQKHPGWGADLAAQAGATPLTVQLIRRHQETVTHPPSSEADRLLQLLQRADDLS